MVLVLLLLLILLILILLLVVLLLLLLLILLLLLLLLLLIFVLLILLILLLFFLLLQHLLSINKVVARFVVFRIVAQRLLVRLDAFGKLAHLQQRIADIVVGCCRTLFVVAGQCGCRLELLGGFGKFLLTIERIAQVECASKRFVVFFQTFAVIDFGIDKFFLFVGFVATAHIAALFLCQTEGRTRHNDQKQQRKTLHIHFQSNHFILFKYLFLRL